MSYQSSKSFWTLHWINSDLLVIGSALAAPWFIVRVPGTSFSMADGLLLLYLLAVVIRLLSAKSVQRKEFGNLPVVGAIFLFIGLLSGVEAVFIENIDLSVSSFISVGTQYVLIMMIFPWIAACFFKTHNIWGFLRLIALGYAIPNIMTLAFLIKPGIFSVQEIFFMNGRAAAMFGNPNSYAAVLTTTLPIYVCLIFTDRGFWRILGLVGSIMALVCLILTASFGGMLVLVCLLLFNLLLPFFWRQHPFRQHFVKSFGVLLTVLFLCTALFFVQWESPGYSMQVAKRMETLSSQNINIDIIKLGSVGVRVALINEALSMVANRAGGFWGHGLGQSGIVSKYYYSVHLLYLLLWIEGGIALLVAYLVFLFIMLRNAIHLSKLEPATGLAVGMGLVAIILFGFVNPHIYLRFFWLPLLPCFVPWNLRWNSYGQ